MIDNLKAYRHFDNLAQNEAIINEFKGNLFEFLVGQNLAREFGIEKNFLTSFSGKIKTQLSSYESWIRENDPCLLLKLPELAKKCVDEFIYKIPRDISDIYILGKSLASPELNSLGECDIALIRKNKEIVPISIKLCKYAAFVNTKSAGIKSIFSKYFSDFDSSRSVQEDFNVYIDRSFSDMAFELYDLAGLEGNGRFDEKWTSSGYSELPGQLNKEMNQRVLEFYYHIIHRLFSNVKLLFDQDKELFQKSILPLLGMTNSEIIQITCFHGQKVTTGVAQKYLYKGIHYLDKEVLKDEFSELSLGELKENISSFEIQLKTLSLQLRIKPMNKFTTASAKVNCSIKQK